MNDGYKSDPLTIKPWLKKRFSIGFNGTSDFFETVILPYKEYISSVYFPPPFSTGIPNAREYYDISTDFMISFCKKLNEIDIKSNLIYNFDGLPTLGEPIVTQIMAFTDLINPDIVTVSNSYIKDLFLTYSNYKLNLSVVYDINSMNKLDMVLENDTDAQIVSLNIGRKKTFDVEFITSIRKKYPNLFLKLLVNEGCIFDCPDLHFHSCCNSMNVKKTPSEKFPLHSFYCDKIHENEYWRFLTGQYVPPQIIHEFDSFVDEFKISTRIYPENNMLLFVLKQYLTEKKVSIYDAITSSGGGSNFCRFDDFKKLTLKKSYYEPYPVDFFEMKSKCNRNCQICDYCQKI